MKSRILAAILVLVAVGLANIIRVPSEQPTIQAGLNGAVSNKDTVLVAPGTYNELITWPTLDGITLLSESGRAVTAIDGQNLGVVITIGSSSVTRATVIKGFTLTKGTCGIYLTAGAPTIMDNRITRCVNSGPEYVDGGGIYMVWDNQDFKPLIQGNEIDGNVAQCTADDYAHGGGIYLGSGNASAQPEVCFNYIHDDTALTATASYAYGGGIWAGCGVLIYGNIISNNVARAGNEYSDGGGMLLTNLSHTAAVTPYVFCNLIINNRSEAVSGYASGGGMTCGNEDYYNVTPKVYNNTIAGNVCAAPEYAEGGGLCNADRRSDATLQNNIIANNTAGTGHAVYRYGGTIALSYNDYYPTGGLSGCSPGIGDIQLDPQFVTGQQGSYYLSQIAAGQPVTSPCVDAGDTLPRTSPLNLDSLLRTWTTRTDSVPDAGTFDMGYHYPSSSYPVGITGPRAVRPRSTVTVAPSPFRDRVRFTASAPGLLRLEITDALGRVVYDFRGAACPSVSWDGRNLTGRLTAPGVYFYRLAVGNAVYHGRLVKVE